MRYLQDGMVSNLLVFPEGKSNRLSQRGTRTGNVSNLLVFPEGKSSSPSCSHPTSFVSNLLVFPEGKSSEALKRIEALEKKFPIY